jgi:hypothetical protein
MNTHHVTLFMQNAARVWNASVFKSSDISDQVTCLISLFIQVCSVCVHVNVLHCTAILLAASFTTLRLIFKVNEFLLSICFDLFFCESRVNDVVKITVNWIVLVRFMFFWPSLSYLKVAAVLTFLGHFWVIPVLLSVYFVREVFLTCFSNKCLLELTLRTFFFFDISEFHHVILCPIFVTLL